MKIRFWYGHDSGLCPEAKKRVMDWAEYLLGKSSNNEIKFGPSCGTFWIVSKEGVIKEMEKGK